MLNKIIPLDWAKILKWVTDPTLISVSIQFQWIYERGLTRWSTVDQQAKNEDEEKDKSRLRILGFVGSIFKRKKSKNNHSVIDPQAFLGNQFVHSWSNLVNIDSIQIADWVLSRNELNSLHIPLVKHFCFKQVNERQIDREWMRSTTSKAKSSYLSRDFENSKCWLNCTIF